MSDRLYDTVEIDELIKELQRAKRKRDNKSHSYINGY